MMCKLKAWRGGLMREGQGKLDSLRRMSILRSAEVLCGGEAGRYGILLSMHDILCDHIANVEFCSEISVYSNSNPQNTKRNKIPTAQRFRYVLLQTKICCSKLPVHSKDNLKYLTVRADIKNKFAQNSHLLQSTTNH